MINAIYTEMCGFNKRNFSMEKTGQKKRDEQQENKCNTVQ